MSTRMRNHHALRSRRAGLAILLAAPTLWLSTVSVLAATGDSLSEREVIRGLKDALIVGSGKAVARLGKNDGFLLNEKVRIPLLESL